MKRVVAEKYRDIDFSRARRGAVVKVEPGKAKISIRLDNAVLEYFRGLVDKAGGGNYQTLITTPCLSTFTAGRPSTSFGRQSGRNLLHTASAAGPTSRRGGRAERAAERDRQILPRFSNRTSRGRMESVERLAAHAASAAPIRSTKLSQ
jgi:hypothetical protein